MKAVALDASFSKTGIATIDTEAKTVALSALKGDGKEHKRFMDIQESIHSYTLPMLDGIISGSDMLVMEEPFPFGMFSSGLYALDTAIMQRFFHIEHISFNPKTLEFIHGAKKHTKPMSVELSRHIINIMTEHGYEVSVVSKGHDASEAFIYLIHALMIKKILPESLCGAIRKDCPNMGITADERKRDEMDRKRKGIIQMSTPSRFG